jgi:hypothetical protein
MKRTQLTFSGVANKAVSDTEVFSDQVDIDEFGKHDLRTVYDPDTVDVSTLNLETRIYISDDGMDIAASVSTWHPMSIEADNGSGAFDPDIVVHRRPAVTASIAKRNANLGFEISGRKIRFGFTEQTTVGAAAGDTGDITSAYLSSRQ